MEENNETTTPPDEALPAAPPAVPVEIAEPTPEVVAPEEGSKESVAKESVAKESVAERLGGPVSRLRTVQGAPVVALAATSFVLLVMTVLLALMVFAPGIAPFRLGTAKSGYLAQRDVGIEKVATRFAQNFLTFDYRTLDADLARLSKDATGNFEGQLTRVRGQKDLIATLKAQQATSRGSVRGVSVESVHGDTATVRVFLSQTVSNKSDSRSRTSFKDVLLTMVKTSKGWKVDNVG